MDLLLIAGGALVAVVMLGLGAAMRAGARMREREATDNLEKALDALKSGDGQAGAGLLTAAFCSPTGGLYTADLLTVHRMVVQVASLELAERLTSDEKADLDRYRKRLDEAREATRFDHALYLKAYAGLRRLAPPRYTAPAEDFGRLMLRKVHAAGDRKPRLDEKAFALQWPDGRTLHLARAHHAWRAAPESERAAVERHWVQVAVNQETVPEGWEEASPGLLPRVRTAGFSANLALMAEARGLSHDEIPRMPLAGDLVIELCWDGERSVASVGQGQLDRWGVGFRDALKQAGRNLVRRGDLALSSPEGLRCFMSEWHDSHDPARLILAEVFHDLPHEGDLLAMAPNSSLLLMADSAQDAALLLMATMAERALSNPGALSAQLLRLEGNRWVPFEVPGSSPVADRFRKLRLLDLKRQYDQQGELLGAVCQKRGEDLFVATFVALEGDTAFSKCSWGEGVPSLLPRTDVVHFARFDAKDEPVTLGEAPWERVIEVVGDLMVPRRLLPERYEVTAFPTPEQLERLLAP